MSEIFQHIIVIFLGYFAIMNPLANTAVFVGLTESLSSKDRYKIAKRALILTFVIIVLFAVLGKALFHFFGISLPALRIAGGVLVSLIGYHMLHGESSSLHKGSDSSPDDIAISPLAVPILAGPGTIATTISYSASGNWSDIIITILVFMILCIITYVCFISGERILAIIGKNVLNIVTRLMGLILTVIGVQMIIEGVAGAVKLY
jgi:multiple antibiotic resistance protein